MARYLVPSPRTRLFSLCAVRCIPEVGAKLHRPFPLPLPLKALSLVSVRLIDFPIGASYPDTVSGCGEHALTDLVRVCGTKQVLDGTPIERGAAMREPYSDRAGWTSHLDITPAELRAELVRVRAGKIPVLFHCSGDAPVAALLEAMQSIAPLVTWRPLRVRIEHGDAISGELMRRVHEAFIIVVQNPSHFQGPELARVRFGEARTAKAFAIRSLIAADIPVAFGSDGPLDPFLNMQFAARNAIAPSESLDVEGSVVRYTRMSAFAEGAETIKGTLAPGMLADLVVLSQDIFSVPIDQLPATRSLLTMVGGRAVLDELH